MESKDNQYHVPNLERALFLFELLAQNPKGFTLQELIKELKYSKSTLFRITTTLVNHNYLTRDIDTKKFQLSRKLLSIGFSSLREQSLIEKSLIFML